jgi:hypothetical protein
MPSVYDTINKWARKTSTSIGEFCFVASQRGKMDNDGEGLTYRLKFWPELPSRDRTADVFRALSVMSTRPINRDWILAHSKLRAEHVDHLLRRLVGEGAVEVVDRSGAPGHTPCPAR